MKTPIIQDRDKLKNVLLKLEEAVDLNEAPKPQIDMNLLIEDGKKYKQLKKRVEALEDEIRTFLDMADPLAESIMSRLKNVKDKTIQTEGLFMKVTTEIQRIPGKTTHSYKGIYERIKEIFDIDARWLNRTEREFRKVTPGKRITTDDLVIEGTQAFRLKKFLEKTTGKKVELKENIFSGIANWVAKNLKKLISPFTNWSNEIDEKFDALIRYDSSIRKDDIGTGDNEVFESKSKKQNKK